MNRPRFIDKRQFVVLTAITVTGTTFLMLPREMAEYSGTAAWLSVLLAGLAGLALAWVLVQLGRRFPDQTPVQYAGQLLGKPIGKLLGIIVVLAAHYYLAILLREFAATFIIPFMPETPLPVFVFTMVLLLVYGMWQGLTGIARTAQIFLPLIVLSILFIVIAPVPLFRSGRLLPLAGPGPMFIAYGAWHSLMYVGELFLMAFLLPSLRRKADYGSALLGGFVLSVVTLSAMTALAIGILGVPLLRTITFPMLSIARLIRLGPFFERLEVIFVVVWFILSFVKLSVLFFITTITLGDVLEIGDPRELAVAVGTVLGFLALVPTSELVWLQFKSYVHAYGQYLEFGLPGLLFIVALVRRGGRKRSAEAIEGE